METDQLITNLFTKNGSLTAPKTFTKCGYSWKVSVSFSEKHRVPAVDLKLECFGIESDRFLSMVIEFRNGMKPGRQAFWHVFDQNRSSFCYRRISTGVRHTRNDGTTIVSFPIDRFLKKEEMGEKYDTVNPKKWPFYVPLTWKVLEDGRIEAEPVKICYNRFEYSLVLKHIATFNSLPDRFHLPKWPKSNRFPVQLEFFEPVWPHISDVILNMHDEPLTSEDCWDMCDILGVYYHQWKFPEGKLLKLNSIANRLGFSKFMDGVGLEGDFRTMCNSEKSAVIIKERRKDHSKDGNTIMSHEIVWNIEEVSNVSRTFKVFGSGNFQWNVTFYLSEFRENKYLSIGCALVGELQEDCIYDCRMNISINSEEERTVRRTLNRVQNTLCIPVFHPFGEIGEHAKLLVKIEVREVLDGNFRIYEMPPVNNVFLKFGDRKVAVNRDYLAHHVKFFETMFFNKNFEEHKKETIEMSSVSYEEMTEFLDTLYHGTKVFKVSHYYHILRMADEWICRQVIEIVEKAIMNSQMPSVNKKKLVEKFNLKNSTKRDLDRSGVAENESKKIRVN